MTIIGIVIPLGWWYFAGMPGIEEPAEGDMPKVDIHYEWDDMLQGDDGHNIQCWASRCNDPDGDIVKIKWSVDNDLTPDREFEDLNDTKLANSYKESRYNYTAISYKSQNPTLKITLTCWDNDGNKASQTITVHNPF